MGLVKVRKTRTERREWEWQCTRCDDSDWGFRTVEYANEYASKHALHHMREIIREREAIADMFTYIIDADRAVQDEHDNYVGTDMAYQPVERWWRD